MPREFADMKGTSEAAGEAAAPELEQFGGDVGVRGIRAVDQLDTAMALLRGWTWQTDPEHRFVFMSSSVLALTGRPPEWHYGKTRQDLGINIASDEEFVRYQEQLDNREPFGPLEYRRWQDGRVFWLRTSGVPLFDDDGVFLGYRGVAREITEEVELREAGRQAEAEITRLWAILRTTIESFPRAISVFDREHKLVLANEEYYAAVGLPASRFPVGSSFHDIIVYLVARGEFRGGEAADIIAEQMAMVASGVVHTFRHTWVNGVRLEISTIPLPCGGFVRNYVDVTSEAELAWRHGAVLQELRANELHLEAAREEVRLLRERLYAMGGLVEPGEGNSNRG